MQSGTKLSQCQSLVSRATIVKMGSTLVRLCDGLERHGLVDYQCGVWEDEIVASKFVFVGLVLPFSPLSL